MRTSIVIGFDFSLDSTGWARGVFDLAAGAHEDAWGVIKGDAPEKATRRQRIERLQRIRDDVFALFHLGLPELVLIEDYAFSKGNQAHYIGELGGVVRLALHERGYHFGDKVFLVSTHQLKKFVTGGGTADKRAMLLGVNKRWGFDDTKSPDDVVDAYGLMRIGEAILSYRSGAYLRPGPQMLAKFQIEVVEEILAVTKKPKGGARPNAKSSTELHPGTPGELQRPAGRERRRASRNNARTGA